MKVLPLLAVIFILVGVVIGSVLLSKSTKNPQQISDLQLTSPAFIDGQTLPVKYTCQGEAVSPPLSISKVPLDTQSLVLILEDPDTPSGPFIHWLVWNISPSTHIIEENTVPKGAVVGFNSVNRNFFFSPCPPQKQHHYVFRLYALDTSLTLPSEAGISDLKQVITGHILGQTSLTGIFP